MPYDHDHVCMMQQPVVCELCNKSYAIGRMKAHKQTKMHIENAEKCGVPSSWWFMGCLLYTSPSPRDRTRSRMPSSA